MKETIYFKINNEIICYNTKKEDNELFLTLSTQEHALLSKYNGASVFPHEFILQENGMHYVMHDVVQCDGYVEGYYILKEGK
jgi:hypothetical protein